MWYEDQADETVSTCITRRRFIEAGVLSASALSVGSLIGCSNKVQESVAAVGAEESSGEWITGACWHGCGGRCPNKVLVKDGVALRQKTDDTHEDSPEYPQQRGCLRGRSQRKQVFSADRLKYPMKRKNWTPDDPNGHLRGIDEWERISWDEALEYAAQGIKNAIEIAGNRSILVSGGSADISRTMCVAGGHTNFWSTGSWGTWEYGAEPCGFKMLNALNQTVNDRFDIENCDYILMMGNNPAWGSMGNPPYNLLQAKKAGAKFIAIDPFFNDSYDLYDADWCPIRPCTDMVFLLGLAYSMLEQDDNGSLIDWDFLDTYTIGFDAEHMPEGSNPEDNFKDYLLGTYDGQPKTPEWASEICGADPKKVREIAKIIGKDNKVAILCGLASSRMRNQDNLPQMFMTIGAMGGHIGKSGHMVGSTENAVFCNGGPALVKSGSNGLPKLENAVDDSINDGELWDAILTGKYHYTGKSHTEPVEVRDIDIRVIWHSKYGGIRSIQGAALGVEAHRKVDMVVTQAYTMTSNTEYADIVLPITTPWERFGGFLSGGCMHTGNKEMMVFFSKVVEPMFEAKSDNDIAIELGEKLGLDTSEIYPFGGKQQFFNTLSTITVCEEDGKTYVPLVTITQDDIDELEVEGEPQEGKISYHDFKEAGVYQVKRKKGDNYTYIAFKDFIDDPENNPVTSESGKFEIYCQGLADMVNGMGFSTIKPIPTYINVVDGYVDTFSDWESKQKGDYPYQSYNIHYLRRAHSNFDNVKQLCEAWRSPIFISGPDAREKGIEEGDAVLITSSTGKSLRPACVTERMMPGVVSVPHGAWIDYDEELGIELGGADNWLTRGLPTGQGVAGYNTCIVNIERSDIELVADVDKPQRIVKAQEE